MQVNTFSSAMVDATVNANFLFGVLTLLNNHEIVLESELRQMVKDVVDFLVYAIEDALPRRPDLLLPFYMSRYAFYSFVARIVALLSRMSLEGDSDLLRIYEQLSEVMRTTATDHLLA